MSYTNFQVGERFPLPIKAQGDGGIFQYDINGAMFILKLSTADFIATEAFRTGQISLGLFTMDDIIFLLYKIDGITGGWGDCPYHLHALAPMQRPDVEKPPEKILNLYLVDSRLDILLAMRTVTLSDAFSQALFNAAEQQLQTPLHGDQYIAQVQSIWKRYTSEQMSAQTIAAQEVDLEIAINPKLQ